MNLFIPKNSRVTLQCVAHTKIYIGEEWSDFVCTGYCSPGEEIEVEIGCVMGTTIIGKDDRMYPIKAEEDDFYVIVAIDGKRV